MTRPVSVAELESLVSGAPSPEDDSDDYRILRCVASGYLADGCSCKAGVPAKAVVAAWGLQRRGGDRRERFFSFMWRGRMWLGYGLRNGCVRGVYCPEHRADRDERATLERLELGLADRRLDPAARVGSLA
jgi:hypothetical protein